MKLSRPWLLPFVPFYYLGSLFVKKMYDWGIWKSITYDFPVITIGNISVGGTGKSPFVAYLLKHFSSKYVLATLSRGYGRTTKDFQLLNETNTASEVGDEPLQFKINFPNVSIAVDADRRNGLTQLKKLKPTIEGIILDDAFQHRKVKGGLQIVLTPYYKLYAEDFSLPAGDLREPKSAANRADIIVVTKCPLDIPKEERKEIQYKLNLASHQQLFFVGIRYSEFVKSVTEQLSFLEFNKEPFTLVTGIANPKPLVDFLNKKRADFKHENFKDHHNFTEEELHKLASYDKILTTEKDFMRLKSETRLSNKLFYLPIEISFLEDESIFLSRIAAFLKST